MVLPSRFATASHVTVVCILALLTHDTCKSVVTPPPLCACWSWTRSAHVVRASTSVAMHPPCKVPNRLQSSGATKSSQATPVPSFLSRLRFEQCWNGIRSKVPASFANDAFGPKTTESKKARARENPSSSSFSSIVPRNFSFFATSTTNYIREKKTSQQKHSRKRTSSSESRRRLLLVAPPRAAAGGNHRRRRIGKVVEGKSFTRTKRCSMMVLLKTEERRNSQWWCAFICCIPLSFSLVFFFLWCSKP